ncbi:unnamed protein product [Effrenium voratum]|nr:unnamed protein product [Effrenium voratum]
MSNGVCVVWTAHEWNCREHDFGVCKCYELSSSGKFCDKWSCYSLEADQEICEMRHTDDGEQVSCWYSPFDMNWNSYNQLMERQNSGGLTTGEQIWWGYNWFVRRLAEESAEMEEKELDQYLDYLRKFNSSQMHEELARAGLPHDVTARQLQVYTWPPVYAYSPVARHQFFYWNDVCIVNGDNLVIARRTCPRWREIETEVSSCWCRKESFDAGACAEWLCEERDVGLFSVLFRTKQSIDQWTVGVEFESYQCTGYTINGHCQSWQGQIESVEEVEWSRCTCPPQGCQNDGAVWLCDEWELPKTRDLFFESHLGGLFGFIFAEIFLCCFFGRSAGDDEGDALFAATFCSCLGGLCLMPFLILTYGFYGFLFAGLPFWLLRILFMCCIVAMNFKMPSMERPSNAVRLKRGASKIIGRGRSVTPDDVAVKDVEIVESNETNNQTNNQTNETISYHFIRVSACCAEVLVPDREVRRTVAGGYHEFMNNDCEALLRRAELGALREIGEGGFTLQVVGVLGACPEDPEICFERLVKAAAPGDGVAQMGATLHWSTRAHLATIAMDSHAMSCRSFSNQDTNCHGATGRIVEKFTTVTSHEMSDSSDSEIYESKPDLPRWRRILGPNLKLERLDSDRLDRPGPLQGVCCVFRICRSHTGVSILCGLTVALALVPEAIAFALAAGLPPDVGLNSAWIIAVVTAIFGGRPAMICGATGSLAVLVPGTVAMPHGKELLFYAVMVMGVLEMVLGVLQVGTLVKLIPVPVMIGFCNGLALVIGLAQFSNFKDPKALDMSHGEGRRLDAFHAFTDGAPFIQGQEAIFAAIITVLAFAVSMWLPKLSTRVPSALVAIVAGTAFEWAITRALFHSETPIVGDIAKNCELPIPFWFNKSYPEIPPFSGKLLLQVLPLSVTMAAVGLLESLMTLNLIDEITSTKGNPTRECLGQGLANLICGAFGGMGGCAMIGQSMINIGSGARSRLSSLTAGLFLLVIVLVAYPGIKQIPVSALVGVMFNVCYHTFEWSSLRLMCLAALPLRQARGPRAMGQTNGFGRSLKIGEPPGYGFGTIL